MRQGRYKESVSDLLIATLASYGSVKIFREILFQRKLRKYKENTLRVSLSRLHARGLVVKTEAGWKIAQEGKMLASRKQLLEFIPSPFVKSSPVNTIVAFDIPEKDRRMRNWLRNQLKIFGYIMLQQSLWIGPGPLPQNFYKKTNLLKIRKHIKTFRIKPR